MGTPDAFACYGFPGKIFPVDLLKKMKWIFLMNAEIVKLNNTIQELFKVILNGFV